MRAHVCVRVCVRVCVCVCVCVCVLEVELRASYSLGRYSNTGATPPAFLCVGYVGDRVLQTILPGVALS
jgi:hypothetical protein